MTNENRDDKKVINRLITLTSYNNMKWYLLEDNSKYDKYLYHDRKKTEQYYSEINITKKKHLLVIISKTDYNIFIKFYYNEHNISTIYLQHIKSIFDLLVIVKYYNIINNDKITEYLKKNTINKKLEWIYVDNGPQPFYLSDFVLSPDMKRSAIIWVFENKIEIINGITTIDRIYNNKLYSFIKKLK